MMLLLGALSVWRLTYMMQAEIGPGRIFERIRQPFFREVLDIQTKIKVKVPKNMIGEILECYYCLSLWLSLPVSGIMFLLGQTAVSCLLYWLSMSALAILLEEARRKMANE